MKNLMGTCSGIYQLPLQPFPCIIVIVLLFCGILFFLGVLLCLHSRDAKGRMTEDQPGSLPDRFHPGGLKSIPPRCSLLHAGGPERPQLHIMACCRDKWRHSAGEVQVLHCAKAHGCVHAQVLQLSSSSVFGLHLRLTRRTVALFCLSEAVICFLHRLCGAACFGSEIKCPDAPHAAESMINHTTV